MIPENFKHAPLVHPMDVAPKADLAESLVWVSQTLMNLELSLDPLSIRSL